MKIKILPRIFFERLRGSPRELLLLENYRIISIQSSHGIDNMPPFGEAAMNSPHLRCFTFDDVDETGVVLPSIQPFTPAMARKIMEFVCDDNLPLLIHCTAGVSRSGAIGETLDWYWNLRLGNHADHESFVRENPQIVPNRLVRRIMLQFLSQKQE